MRCSLKDGFIILLIFSFTPFEGKGYPLFLYKSSIADRSANFNDLSAMSRVEQSLDSFPKLGDYNKNSHKIVKKQMTASDYKRTQKNKRSTFSFQESSNFGDNLKCPCRENSEQAIADSTSNDSCKREKSAFSNSKQRRNLGMEAKFSDGFKGDIFPGLPPNKKEKLKQINENKKQQMKEKKIQKLVEKQIQVALHKNRGSLKKTQSSVENPTEPQMSEEQKVKAAEELCKKSLERGKKVLEDITEKGLKPISIKTTENTLAEKRESLIKPKLSFDYKNFQLNDSDIKEESRALRNMVGCTMGRFCRFPDVQNNESYFECESDENGCIKLKYKNCPKGEIFSSRFLECVKPFFWKIVDRQKRSLWNKGKKKQHSKTWEGGQSANAWTDVTHEEGRQFPLEMRPKCKPKLVVYHLKVKKGVNEDFQKGKKEQRSILRVPNLAHSKINRRLTQKVTNLRKKHQLFPRSFIIRINKKEGRKNDHEESVSEDETDETEDNGDDEDDDEDDEEVKDDETSEEEEDTEDDDEEKPVEKSGIKEFFKSAKEAITNKAKFNEPADTSFTLDKTNSYSKNKKFDGSDMDSKKVLIDADIKVDKALGKTLKRILGKRKDENFSSEGSINDRESQDLMNSEQITKYENLIESNPRLKRYFLVSLGEKEN